MKQATILVCDDQEGVRESLQLILGSEYSLAFAADGEEAFHYMEAHDPDLAILDVKMPKVNGLEVVRMIKERKPGVRVLMITGYESSDVAAQASKLGVAGYLTKPFDGQRILAQVRALLGSQPA